MLRMEMMDKMDKKIGPGVTEHANRVLMKNVLAKEAQKRRPKFVTEVKVAQSELKNSVTIHIDGQSFVLGRAAALCLTKRLQEITHDWAFRYLAGSRLKASEIT